MRLTAAMLVCFAGCISAYQPEPARPAQRQAETQSNQTPNTVRGEAPPVTVYNVTQAPDEPPPAQPDKTGRQKFVDSLYDPIAWLTFALLIMAGLDFWQYLGEINDTRLIERAYVDIAHRGPLGFHEPGGIWMTVGIKNCGRTPADVLGGAIGFVFAEDSKPPDWTTLNQTALTPSFLVPDKRTEFRTMIFPIPQECIDRVQMDSIELDGPDPMEMWLVGYVDYRDKFGREHRAGYGRRFRPTAFTNPEGQVMVGDLVFDHTTAEMNYDRPLLRSDDRPYMKHPHRKEQGQPQKRA